MVRTMSVFIWFLLQILILKAGCYRLFPCITGSFRTLSSSPSNGPFFISAKPYLMVTKNLNNVPLKLSPDENCTQHQDVKELLVQETADIEEQDIKIDVTEPTTDKETVLADEHEMTIEETVLSNQPVVLQDDLENTENIEDNELKNMPLKSDTPVEVV